MDEIRWPGLDARLRGRRVEGLRYDPDEGSVVVELGDDTELRVSGDLEGCGIYVAYTFLMSGSNTPFTVAQVSSTKDPDSIK